MDTVAGALVSSFRSLSGGLVVVGVNVDVNVDVVVVVGKIQAVHDHVYVHGTESCSKPGAVPLGGKG